MKRHRNVKLVATLGPASSDYKTISALISAGADVFRLNMSHGSHAEIRATHAAIRAAERAAKHPVCILADLQGPKLRCGRFAGGQVQLDEGQHFRVDLDRTPGDETRVCLPHPEIFDALKPGATLLVNDGRLRLIVERCGADHAECRVAVGGTISDHKGVNLPDVVLPLAALTRKDLADLEFVCALGIDWLALSFVQRPEDVAQARALAAGRAQILAKIEKPSAVETFDGVLEQADGVMIARGDLGVELPAQKVPPIQKHLVHQCRAAGKPVIVATQMLESMITSPVPTRAEVSDVATAIYEGADAIMLSAESAAGRYPIEAVQTMDAIAREVEGDLTYKLHLDSGRIVNRATISEAITAAAREIAETTEIKAICCYTQSGMTATLAARERPCVPVLALTPDIRTARRLCLTWGLTSIHIQGAHRFRDAVVAGVRAAKGLGLAGAGDQVAVAAGLPLNQAGSTNVLRVASVDEDALILS